MIAINIAAQIVVRKGGLQPQSLQQIYSTYVFIKVLAISGYLPVTFTVFTLHLIGMVSWYLMILSVSSVILSIATLLAIGNFDPSTADLNDLSSSYATGGPQECGYVQPNAFCYTPIEEIYSSGPYTQNTTDMAFSMLAFCVVVLLLLAADKSRITKWQITQRSLQWSSTRLGSLSSLCVNYARKAWDVPIGRRLTQRAKEVWLLCISATGYLYGEIKWKISTNHTFYPILHFSVAMTSALRRSSQYSKLKPLASKICFIVWTKMKQISHILRRPKVLKQIAFIAVYTTFSGLYFYYFALFSENLAWFAITGTYSTSWNFGQIVAITVWAPPICEYIHLEMREFLPQMMVLHCVHCH